MIPARAWLPFVLGALPALGACAAPAADSPEQTESAISEFEWNAAIRSGDPKALSVSARIHLEMIFAASGRAGTAEEYWSPFYKDGQPAAEPLGPELRCWVTRDRKGLLNRTAPYRLTGSEAETTVESFGGDPSTLARITLALGANDDGAKAIECWKMSDRAEPTLAITYAEVRDALFNARTGAYVVLDAPAGRED